jgi:hypothetical protein
MKRAKSPLSKTSTAKGHNGGNAPKLPAGSGKCDAVFDLSNPKYTKSINKFLRKDANDQPVLDAAGKPVYDTKISYKCTVVGGEHNGNSLYLRFRPSDTMSDEANAGFADGTIVAWADELLKAAMAGDVVSLAIEADDGYEKARKVDGAFCYDDGKKIYDKIEGSEGVGWLALG